MCSASLHSLARAHLHGRSVRLAAALEPDLRDAALAACAVGCDHSEGEQLVGIIDDSYWQGVFVGAVFTERCYAWRNLGGWGSFRWADAHRAHIAPGVILDEQHIELLDGTMLCVPATSVSTAHFFRAACALRPLLAARATAGAASCAELLDRTIGGGRGQRFGCWLSPLAPAELAHMLALTLGAPLSSETQGSCVVADFRLPSSWVEQASIQGGALQLKTLRAAGYGRPLRRVRLMAQPAALGSMFNLQGLQGPTLATPLSQLSPTLLARLLGVLLELEQRAMLLRPQAALAPQPARRATITMR